MTTANPTPQWSCFEQSFISAVTYADPLQEAALQVTFVSPSGQTRLVSGFWDGDTTWRVRFSPDELGTWTSTAICSDEANIGLHHQSGAFTCVPASGETRFERHGSLRLSDNCRFFIHADGTPFFWLADTAWSGPMFSTDEEWAYYLHQRVRQKFTAVQWMTTQTLSMPDGNLEGQMAFTGHERIAINPTFFQRLDAKLARMNQAGLLAAPVLLWAAEWSTGEVNNLNPGFTLPEKQAILLARYMVARWAAYHVLWILPGDGHYTGLKAERWRRIGRAVFADMPGALVTLHPSGLQWYADDFRDESWLSLIGYQSSHSGNDQTLSWIVTGPPAQKWAETPPRPIINLEPCYEHHIDLANPDQRFDAHAVRQAIYWSLLVSSTGGVTYGGHGVWGWDDGTKAPMNHPKTGIPLPWQQALTMPAAEQMAHLAELFGSIEWWRLRPAPELIANQPGEVTPARYIAAARSEAGELALIYIPEDCLLEVRLEELRADLSAQWFNPRTGERRDIGPIITEKIWLLETPGPGDWLLLLH